MEKLIVFDGNSILNRAFYGVRPLSNKEGLPTHAVFGFVNIIRRAMQEAGENLKYAAIAFDRKEPTFRHKACDFYKATRKGMPEELAVQLPYAKEVASALGLTVVETPGFEADDIIGTLTEAFSSRGTECIIVTGDRDSFQLVNDRVTVHLAANNETRITGVKEILDLYGVAPKGLIEIKAIMGDSSDNIPGVAGIGEKGAIKLIGQYGSVEAFISTWMRSRVPCTINWKTARTWRSPPAFWRRSVWMRPWRWRRKTISMRGRTSLLCESYIPSWSSARCWSNFPQRKRPLPRPTCPPGWNISPPRAWKGKRWRCSQQKRGSRSLTEKTAI